MIFDTLITSPKRPFYAFVLSTPLFQKSNRVDPCRLVMTTFSTPPPAPLHIGLKALLYQVSLCRLDYFRVQVVSTSVDSSRLHDIFTPPPQPLCIALKALLYDSTWCSISRVLSTRFDSSPPRGERTWQRRIKYLSMMQRRLTAVASIIMTEESRLESSTRRLHAS